MILRIFIAISLIFFSSLSYSMQNQQPSPTADPCNAAAFRFLRGYKQSPRVDEWNAEWDPYGWHAIQGPMVWRLTAYVVTDSQWKKLGRLEHSGYGKDFKIIIKDDVSPCTKAQVINALQQEFFGKKEKV